MGKTGKTAVNINVIKYKDPLVKLYPVITSYFSPAVASYGDKIYVAWTNKKSVVQLAVFSFKDADPTITFVNNPVLASRQTSITGPALAADEKLVYLSWIGTDGEKKLNFCQLDRADLENTAKVNVNVTTYDGEASDYPPALAVFKSNVFLAWTGTDLKVYISGGGSFEPDLATKQSLGNGVYGPALTTGYREEDGSDRLFLGWKRTNSKNEPSHFLVTYSRNGSLFVKKKCACGTLKESSDFQPSLAYFRKRLYLAWTGQDASQRLNLNTFKSIDNFEADPPYMDYPYVSAGKKRIFRFEGCAALAIVPVGSRLLLAWFDRQTSSFKTKLWGRAAIIADNKENLEPFYAYSETLKKVIGYPSNTLVKGYTAKDNLLNNIRNTYVAVNMGHGGGFAYRSLDAPAIRAMDARVY